MLHTYFVEMARLFRKRRFLRSFTIYEYGGHLGHLTSIILINFHCHVPKTYIQNLVKNGPVVFEKGKF